MARTARAVVAEAFGPPETFRLLERDPGDPGPGEVRIAIHAAGVSFVDALIVSGGYQVKPALPAIPGSECAGVVEAVGDGVDPCRIGQRVMVSALGGAFREIACVAASHARPVPAGMMLEEAAVFRISYATAYHALVQRGRLCAGETLLVLGAGGAVGYAAVEIGKALGARVIASASPGRQALARRGGADEVVDSRADDWRTAVRDANLGRPVDVVFDPVGGTATEPAFRSLAWNGRHLVIGFAGGAVPALPTNLALLKGAALIGVDVRQFGMRDAALDGANFAALCDLYRGGHLHPPIGRTYPIEQFAAAMEAATRGTVAGRIVLMLGQPAGWHCTAG